MTVKVSLQVMQEVALQLVQLEGQVVQLKVGLRKYPYAQDWQVVTVQVVQLAVKAGQTVVHWALLHWQDCRSARPVAVSLGTRLNPSMQLVQ